VIHLPILDIEDVPMRLNSLGKLEFTEPNKEAVLGSFAIQIFAESSEIWEVESVFLGTQELRGPALVRAVQYFEEKYGDEIREHIHENLQDVKDDMAYAEKYEWRIIN
jgi:hypothetical protein